MLLDHAGVPDGLDLAWRSKHFLGAPVPGASVATVNLAHVVAAVEFTVAEMAVRPGDDTLPFSDEIKDDPEQPRVEAVGSGGGRSRHADPAEAGQLDRRAADVEAGDGAQDVDLDPFHPAERQAAIAAQGQPQLRSASGATIARRTGSPCRSRSAASAACISGTASMMAAMKVLEFGPGQAR